MTTLRVSPWHPDGKASLKARLFLNAQDRAAAQAALPDPAERNVERAQADIDALRAMHRRQLKAARREPDPAKRAKRYDAAERILREIGRASQAVVNAHADRAARRAG